MLLIKQQQLSQCVLLSRQDSSEKANVIRASCSTMHSRYYAFKQIGNKMPIRRQRENILMTPFSKQEAVYLLHSAPPTPTCPLLFPLISLFLSSTCLFSQTAADCRRRRRAMSSDCELGWFGTLGRCDKRCPGPAWPRPRGDTQSVVTGHLHGDRAVRGCWASRRKTPVCYLTGAGKG